MHALSSSPRSEGATSPVTWILGSLEHSRLFKSQMKISESLAPEARRFPCVNKSHLEIYYLRKRWQQEREKEAHTWDIQSLPCCNLGRVQSYCWEATNECFHSELLLHGLTIFDQLKCSTCKGLKSRALTAPVCFCLWAITGSFPEDRTWVTL
jgi:hypothetical protein